METPINQSVPRPRTGIAAAFCVAVFLLVLVATTGYYSATGAWQFPRLASLQGREMDNLFRLIFAITGAAFVAAQVLIAYLVVRYRHRPGLTASHSGQTMREWTWVLLPAVLLLVADVVIEHRSDHLWQILRGAPPEDALTVEVTGEQFNWSIRYPGEDGKFGRTQARLVSDDNIVGIDSRDPAARDDVVVDGELCVPVNRPVRVLLRSKDVLHAFWVPHFRIKQDCVPGFTIPIWFTPNRAGQFEIACAELCGMGHYKMRASLEVVDQAKFESWLDDQSTFSEQ